MVFLSLFNGMNTLRVAAENIGLKVDKYYSSEIKSFANKLTDYHYPDTIHLGDITKWKEWNIDFGEIDFIGSGSPCQDLSIAGKRKGISGSRSGLFFIFIEILNYVKSKNPNVLFLQENVGSADKKEINIMNSTLQIYPKKINSSLFTGQLRERYYWSNIMTEKTLFDIKTYIPEPEDRGITFQSILESGYTNREKARAILESESRAYTDMTKMFRRYFEKGFGNIVYNNPECKFRGDNSIRLLTQIELERLQGFKDGFTAILNRKESASLLGDGWTLPVIEYILSFIKK